MASDTSYEEKAAHGARTQSLFRVVNERVQDINEVFSHVVPLGDWICECASHSCAERVAVTLPEYEEIRADPMRFLIAPSDGHVFDEIENVVEKTDRFWVVEKTGMAGELAASADPRRAELRLQPGRGHSLAREGLPERPPHSV